MIKYILLGTVTGIGISLSILFIYCAIYLGGKDE